ncbi:MAG: hypothetical protein ACAH20_12790 [Methylobacteriaceae bacterium]|jgi:hypothetical protein|uniref:Uncharacterized protein n=1 Tax=Methylorubrum extorquens TaxID=408 RepID=A0AAX3WHY3_METEX|nr:MULTISPECIES: hypothetical protein [Methylobacteriaceae]WHQ70972.1 hypothetical protein KEC54_05035 [Methylorubrum extorquens]
MSFPTRATAPERGLRSSMGPRMARVFHGGRPGGKAPCFPEPRMVPRMWFSGAIPLPGTGALKAAGRLSRGR